MLYYHTYPHATSSEWVTFVHGAGGSSSIWYRQIKAFKAQFNVLLVDLRGHGRSKMPTVNNMSSYTFEQIGDDVMEVLDHLDIKKTHWVGISLGTIIIRDITERYRDRTHTMIMGGAVMKLNLRGRILMRLGLIIQSVVPYIILYKLVARILMPRPNHRESRNLFIREAKKLYKKEFSRWMTLAAEVNPLLRFFRINDIKVPTLYIMGSQDYMFLPSIRKLVQHHEFSELKIIQDCGHVVNVERPQTFNNISLDFLLSYANN